MTITRDHLYEAMAAFTSSVYDPSIHCLVRPCHPTYQYFLAIKKMAMHLGYPRASNLFMFVDFQRKCLSLAIWEGQPPRPDYPTAMQVVKAWEDQPDITASGVYRAARLVEPAWSSARLLQQKMRSEKEARDKKVIERQQDRDSWVDHFNRKGEYEKAKAILRRPWMTEEELESHV